MSLLKYFEGVLEQSDYLFHVKNILNANPKELMKIADIFNRYGFAVVQCMDSSSTIDNLLATKPLFGKTLLHTRADENDMITLESTENPMAGFLGTSNALHPLHTDGQYMVCPPNITVIACEEQASQGGDTTLLSCHYLYQYLKLNHSESVPLLFESDVYCVHREGTSLTRPIFEFGTDGRISMAFRYDETLPVEIKKEAETIIEELLCFIRESKNILRFKLASNQLLILDNRSVLHGRDAFERQSPRKLHRLVFEGNAPFANEQMKFGFLA